MTNPVPTHSQGSHVEMQLQNYSKTLFGFWSYIMSDCILFGILFSTFMVLRNATFGGPSGKEIVDLRFALTETFILLASSFTCGIAMVAAHKGRKKVVLGWFLITFLLGISFLVMELTEFTHLVREGNSWERSAFLSAFFTLVGTHGFHITVGLLWMGVMMIQLMVRDFSLMTLRKLTCLSMFWHFLDIVWIFIFTIVYLMGTL